MLDDVVPAAFSALLHYACCVPRPAPPSFFELVDLALLADRFAIEPLRVALEKEAARRITPVECPALLNLAVAADTGLAILPSAAAALACRRFEAVAATAEFVSLLPAALYSVVDDDHLSTAAEEHVLEAVVCWLRADPARLDGPAPALLLSAVRFPFIRPEYLEGVAQLLLPEVPLLELMAREALHARASAAIGGCEAGLARPPMSVLSPRALLPRVGPSPLAARAWV